MKILNDRISIIEKIIVFMPIFFIISFYKLFYKIKQKKLIDVKIAPF